MIQFEGRLPLLHLWWRLKKEDETQYRYQLSERIIQITVLFPHVTSIDVKIEKIIPYMY